MSLTRWPQPAHPPFYIDFMSNQLATMGVIAPGQTTNLQWTDLDEGHEEDFDGMPGLPAKIKAQAITLPYSIEWRNSKWTDWLHEPSAQEQAERELAKTAVLAEIEALTPKVNAATGDEKTKLQELLDQKIVERDQLNDGSYSYFITAYQYLNSGVSGIKWELQAANVPVVINSVFTLGRNRAFSLRLYRYKAPEGQAHHDYTIEFGNGKTLYAIVIGEDGNSAHFIHYRPVNAKGSPKSAKERQDKLAELEAILDRGRLTVAERAQVLTWEQRIAVLRAKDGKPNTADSAEIESLQTQIQALKDSKHLTADDEQQRKDLEYELYLEKIAFKLNEEAVNMIGRAIDITVQFLQSGYVVVQVDDSRFVYENKRLTELGQYGTGLPAGSRITLKSNGGVWGVVFGHPKYANYGTVLTQPFDIPYPFSNDNVVLTSDSAYDENETDVQLELIEIREEATYGDIVISSQFQLQLTLVSDNRSYTPEVYRIACHIKAGGTPALGAPVWDSQVQGENELSPSGNHIKDLLIEGDRRRGLKATVVLHAASAPPLNISDCAALLWLYDRDNETNVTMMTGGRPVAHETGRVGEISTASGFATIGLVGSEIILEVVGPEAWLDKNMVALVPADGEFPNDAMRTVCRDLGMPESLYANIPAGNIGLRRIKPPKPGKFPLVKPSQNARGWEWLQYLSKNFCPGYDLYSDKDGIRLSKFSVRNRPELTYDGPNNVSYLSPLCLRNEFKMVKDIRRYLTGVTVIGARDRLTGQRYVQTETIPQATEPGFEDSLFWLGNDSIDTIGPDDSLTDDAMCLQVAREELNIRPETPQGLPPVFGPGEIDFDPSLVTGDMPRLFGIKAIINNIEAGALAGDKGQRMVVDFQIAEDMDYA
jgi:hypothetical protein